jgi:hypothetical protein
MIAQGRFSAVRKWPIGITLSTVCIIVGCLPQGSPASDGEEPQATTIEGAETLKSAPGMRPPNERAPSRQMMRQGVRTWSPAEDVIRELDLSSDQLERIQANESDFAAAMRQARALEKKATIRLIRSLGRDPLDLEIVEARRTNMDLATLDRLRIDVDRVANLREILELEQYRELVVLDPGAVRIGFIQPPPIIQVKVEDSASLKSEEGAPPMVTPTETIAHQ